MKLAEGLALRSDAARRVEQLRTRIAASARYQEGEEPPEDAAALLAEAGVALDDLEGLIRRVNRTNAAAQIGAGETITDALAHRDVLRARHAVVTAAADAAAGRSQGGIGRQLRSELKMLAALPVAQLRAQARRDRPRTARAGHPDSALQLGGRPTGLTRATGGAGSRGEGVRNPRGRGQSALLGSAAGSERGSIPQRTVQPSTLHR